MPKERQFQEAIARCVSILVYRHNCVRASHAPDWTDKEITAVAADVLKLMLPASEVGGMVADAVLIEVVARFGHEVGARMSADFAKKFDGRLRRLVLKSKAGPATASPATPNFSMAKQGVR